MKLFGAKRRKPVTASPEQGVTAETLDLLRTGAAYGSVEAIPEARLRVEPLTAESRIDGVTLTGTPGLNCWLVRDARHVAQTKLKIGFVRSRESENVVIRLGRVPGNLTVRVAGNNSALVMGRCRPTNLVVDLARNAQVVYGDASSAIDVRIVAENGDLTIGEDCMMSGQITIHATHQHGLVDLDSRRIVSTRPHLRVGNHVWLGFRTLLVGNCTIGDGSILGAGAVAAGTYPACSAVVGNPAAVQREGVTWSRDIDRIDPETETFLSHIKQAGGEAKTARADLTVLPALED